MPRLKKNPPERKLDEAKPSSSATAERDMPTQRDNFPVPDDSSLYDYASPGRAQIYPTRTVKVRRLEKKPDVVQENPWDLAVDFDLEDFAQARQPIPPIIREYLEKATQQYHQDRVQAFENTGDGDESSGSDADSPNIDVTSRPQGYDLKETYAFEASGGQTLGHQDTVDSRSEYGNTECCCDEVQTRLERGIGGVFFCYGCGITYCDRCWNAQVPHRRNVSGHEKVDITIARMIKDTLDVELDEKQQAKLHLLDEPTTWFGAAKDKQGAVFRDFDRYATLVAGRNLDDRKRCYPALVSFVGETGAGKSSLIKLLVSTTSPGIEAQTPVVGSSKNSETPTSGDVHLYPDMQTYDTDRPLFYADCEGLHGGTLDPMGVRLRTARQKATAPVMDRPRTASFEKHLRRRHHAAERQIMWVDSSEKATRDYFVKHLYPRLLYTFSDVIVFVVKNARRIEDVVQQLITWADAVIQSSSNQPVLPHAVIVINNSDNTDPRMWDTDYSTEALLNNIQHAVNQNPTLRRLAIKSGYRVESARALLLLYYSSVRVIRIPNKSSPTIVHSQIQNLYKELKRAAESSHASKLGVRMRLNCEELQPYLQKAFDHFCSDLDEAFDFVKASYDNSSIPTDLGGNILKLSFRASQVWRDKLDGPLLFKELSFIIAGCVMLDAVRQRKLGTAKEIFSEYMDHFDMALDEFCDKFWPCEFVSNKGRCVNVKLLHSKGHQSKKGEILGLGEYRSSFTSASYSRVFLDEIYQRLHELLADLARESKSTDIEQEVAATLHKKRILGPFFRHLGGAEQFVSHSACLACLVSPAEHTLPCGHVLCTPCLQDFGKMKGPTLIEMKYCPLHYEETADFKWPIAIVPPNAGIRILCIDGGGVRGIVPLTVLEHLEHEMMQPIQNFFDLMIGTSTGGIIALGLGEKGWTVSQCIRKFKMLAKDAFKKHTTFGWQYLDSLIHSWKHGKYKTRPLEELLREEYGEDKLFGGLSRETRATSHQTISQCKVAVTTTTTDGRPCLLANYNRQDIDVSLPPSTPHLPRGDSMTILAPVNPARRRYDFLRPEDPAHEMLTWQAARATSAAPKIFEPYTHSATGQTFMDGGIYFNNPVEVALREHSLIWPDNQPDTPDIVLSLGTGYLVTRKQRVNEQASRGVISYFKLLRQIAVDHVKSSQNSEDQWHAVMDRVPKGLKSRFMRQTCWFSTNLPKLDDVTRLEELINETKMQRSHSEIRDIANRLIASCFYFEPVPDGVKKNEDGSVTIVGTIRCRFAPTTRAIADLGALLWNRVKERNSHAHSPSFIIEERAREKFADQAVLSHNIIERMIMNAQFDMKNIKITVSGPVSTQ